MQNIKADCIVGQQLSYYSNINEMDTWWDKINTL